MSSADYSFAVVQVFKDERVNNVVQIVDLDAGNMSVTNDIENVLLEIQARLPDHPTDYIWIYRDSMENWDEIQLDDVGNFQRFNALPRGRCFTEVQAEAVVCFLARHVNARGIGAR